MCILYLIGDRNKKQTKKKSSQDCLSQALYLRPRSFFTSISWDDVLLTRHLENVYLRISFIFFFLKFWINKWMRIMTVAAFSYPFYLM